MGRIKLGDNVKVITGKQRGAQGVIEKVFTDNGKVIVGGVNMVKRHQKAASGKPGGIIEKPAAIDVSNVMVMCPHCQLATRIGYHGQGTSKHRICKKCGKEIA